MPTTKPPSRHHANKMRPLYVGKRRLSADGTLPQAPQAVLQAAAKARRRIIQHIPKKGTPTMTTTPVVTLPVSVDATYDQVSVGSKYVVLSQSPSVTPARCVQIAAALSKQLNEHIGAAEPNGYGVGGNVRAATAELPPQPDEIVLLFTDVVDQQGALAYHDKTAAGLPRIEIFAALDAQDGVDPSASASHELGEAAIDPELNSCVQDPTTGKIWAQEICDGVEDDTYFIDGVAMSNFATPFYFSPPPVGSGLPPGGKFDYMGLCKSAFEIRPGGYGQYWDGSQWQMVQVDASGSSSSNGPTSAQRARRRARKALMGRVAKRNARVGMHDESIDVIHELLKLGYQL